MKDILLHFMLALFDVFNKCGNYLCQFKPKPPF